MIEEPVTCLTDPLTQETIELGGPRPCTDDDIDDIPDRIAYELAEKHLNIHRCHAAFYRFTFDRTGNKIEPDERAILFWKELDNKNEDDDDVIDFYSASEIREKAYTLFDQELINDYMRSTDRHPSKGTATRYNAAIELVKILIE